MHLFHHDDSLVHDGKTKVKICGIRRLESAEAAVKAGADMLGFNFVNESHSYINPITAKEIIEKVHKHTHVVGVFKDATVEEINELGHYLKLHYVQLHGNEDPTFISKIKVKVLRPVTLSGEFGLSHTIPATQQYNAEHLMVDHRHVAYLEDYERVKEIASHLPIFVTGLAPENVAQAVAAISPFGVDVSEGVEVNGYEDVNKIAAFVANAKSAVR